VDGLARDYLQLDCFGGVVMLETKNIRGLPAGRAGGAENHESRTSI
jgi:hypothetical protein